MAFVPNFLIPLIEIVFIGGIGLTIIFIIGKALYRAWSRQTKFFFKYKIFRKNYPDDKVKWCLDSINRGIGYYEAKKYLLINMTSIKEINEIMWIYDQILNEMEINIKNRKKQINKNIHNNNYKGGKLNWEKI